MASRADEAIASTNLSAGYRWSRMTITAGVSDLFDRYYVDALSYQRDPFRTGTRVPEPGSPYFAASCGVTPSVWNRNA